MRAVATDGWNRHRTRYSDGRKAIRLQRGQIGVGIIGPGKDWDTLYAPALQRLSNRVRVLSVSAPTYLKAAAIAKRFEAATAQSVTEIFLRPDISAVLILDTGWQGEWPVRLLARYPKHAYIRADVAAAANLERVVQMADHAGTVLSAELRMPYWPSTIRLRELLATGTAPLRSIEIRSDTWPGHVIADACCWIETVVGQAVSQLTVTDGGRREVGFREHRPNTPQVRFARHESNPREGTETASVHVTGDDGRAIALNGPNAIAFPDNPDSSEQRLDEFGDVSLLLDLAFRRMAGGLVPVPTIADLQRYLWLAADGRE